MYGSSNACCDGNEGVGLPRFHPLFRMVLISGSYSVCLCMRACSGNLSWQYVNSMSWTVCEREGAIGVCVWFGALITHRMSCLSLA
jgi:hypothetical protein